MVLRWTLDDLIRDEEQRLETAVSSHVSGLTVELERRLIERCRRGEHGTGARVTTSWMSFTAHLSAQVYADGVFKGRIEASTEGVEREKLDIERSLLRWPTK